MPTMLISGNHTMQVNSPSVPAYRVPSSRWPFTTNPPSRSPRNKPPSRDLNALPSTALSISPLTGRLRLTDHAKNTCKVGTRIGPVLPPIRLIHTPAHSMHSISPLTGGSFAAGHARKSQSLPGRLRNSTDRLIAYAPYHHSQEGFGSPITRRTPARWER